MSVRATSWAWERGREGLVKGGELLTLLRIADHADNSGVCWPGEESLAEYTAQGDRTVRRHLADLEEAGFLHRELVFRKEGRGRSYNGIFLHIDQPAKLAARKSDVQPATDDRSTGQSEHDQPANPDTALIREPTTEPSGTNNNVDPLPDPAVELYEFWKTSTGRNGGTKLTDGRRRAVKKRLAEGRTVEEIRRAIANVAASDWHMKRGRHANRDGEKHDDITLICRNGELFEKYRDLGGSSSAGAGVPTGPITDEDGARRVWNAAREKLRGRLPESTFGLWIEGFEAAGRRGDHLVLVDTRETGGGNRVQWASSRYTSMVLDALKAAGGEYSDVEFVDETQLEMEAR